MLTGFFLLKANLHSKHMRMLTKRSHCSSNVTSLSHLGGTASDFAVQNTCAKEEPDTSRRCLVTFSGTIMS